MPLLPGDLLSHWKPQFTPTVGFSVLDSGGSTSSPKSGEAKANRLQVFHILTILHWLHCWNLL
jgi:hypothetical protein